MSLQEFINRQAPKQPIFLNEFRFLDADHNQLLTKNEFLATVSKEQQSRALRDFTVFNLQDDETLSYEEYLNILSRDHRKLDHPIMHRVTKHMQDLEVSWKEWDINSDSKLSKEEFSSSNLSRSIPGLALTKWEDWDRNGDNFLDQSEAKQVLEIAYGLRYPTGELLWAPSGLIISGMLFDYVDKNGDHLIDLEEAKLAKFGFGDNTQTPELFKQMDQNDNGTLTMAEWKSDLTHWIDPVGSFLAFDTDFDGRLSREELLSGTPSWQLPVTEFLFPGFDLNGDTVLSLQEYRETPFANLALIWQELRTDRDNDGYLSITEFQWDRDLFGAALAQEYFQRFDVNQDGKLSLDEFTFRINQAKAPLEIVFRLRDSDQNGLISFEEILEDLKLPENANEKQKLHYETTLIRIEDAFRRADRNQDNSLDQAEFQSEAAREVVAPHLVVKKKNFSSSRVSRSSLSKETEEDDGMWVILALNVLLLAGVLVFLVRKMKLFTR
ncbi:EF-hand domain-containing protein [Gimesia aquarii]|uniref:EF hand n=1 Tax=Gimesia aquarii TaxID=2527964 RepID=A0A517WX77_9PLAN|nr:EF-hand domain-containing protein [Gimesia aquarii]QDU09839.1 EF hand [Gimesia aquarii]